MICITQYTSKLSSNIRNTSVIGLFIDDAIEVNNIIHTILQSRLPLITKSA